ncbi:MAG: hypothetical protein JST26_01625 [Bacteroidetes bacterium]|nr:hypothetical protein [Bacteroidota bacterium]
MRFLFLIIVIPFVVHSQNDTILKHFNQEKNRLNKRGMVVLTSWAGLNLAAGACGYALSDNETDKSFHVMNAAWGAINLGIALPGLLSKQHSNQNLYSTQSEQTKTEKIFLANAMLDVAYVAGGFYLREYGANQSTEKRRQQFTGYGNSVILQGGGLLLFDAAMTFLNNRHRKKALDPFLQKINLGVGPRSVSFRYRF